MLHISVPPIAAAERVRLVKFTKGEDDLFEHRRKKKQVDQVGIELRTATAQNDLGGGVRTATGAIAAGVRDGVVRVGDAHDASLQRDVQASQTAWISGTIPALVMTEDTFAEIGIEAAHRLEHFGAALRMGGDELPLTRGQAGFLVDDIVDRGMNFSDVVKKGDPLDAPHGGRIEVCRSGENQRICGDSPDVSTRFMVVRVDCVEEGLEGGGGEAFSRTARIHLAGSEQASDCSGGKAGNRMEESIGFRHVAPVGQEAGDTLRERIE